ncbi:hypothetical protein Tco_0731102 [Tanacetum coccineum]
MWILGSLCDSLQEQVITTPGNAKALCDRLKELFHDNKDARAINLDYELRSIKIGKMTVNEYCTKIRSMVDRLINLGCVVSDENLVIYTINGLDSSQGILRVAPALHPSQATLLPSAFSTMTLHDPTWNMDTGATSHLNSNARNLSTLFNSRLYQSIHVGDGNSIPVTNTGHSSIPSLHRPLHLHNVPASPILHPTTSHPNSTKLKSIAQ